MEVWKPLYIQERIYYVSNTGRVKNKYNKILHAVVGSSGYEEICLCVNYKRYYKRVHRLVAQAFLPNPNNYPCINHINGNKLDNNVSNLEWCSTKYNVNYGNCIAKRANSKKKPVQRIDKDGKIYTYLSATDAGKELGINPNFISRCCTGERKTLYGETWNFI